MKNHKTVGRINSIQTLGTLDGPGVRFVVFLQGCPLHCGCCHNPETQKLDGGTEYSAEALADTAERYKEYFGAEGGATLSGGEPLVQAKFAKEFFEECQSRGINTCLDTSGCILNAEVLELMAVTDRVLLDIKYTTDEQYQRYVGCSMEKPMEFLRVLNQKNIPVTLRQVIVPTLNDDEQNINCLNEIIKNNPCIDKAELLGFKKLCTSKYKALKIPFPFESFPEPSAQSLAKLQKMLVV